MLDRRQLAEVADKDDVRIGEAGGDPERRDRRHRRLIEDNRVKAPLLHRLALVGARQRCGNDESFANHELLDPSHLVLDLLQSTVDCADPVVQSPALDSQRGRVRADDDFLRRDARAFDLRKDVLGASAADRAQPPSRSTARRPSSSLEIAAGRPPRAG